MQIFYFFLLLAFIICLFLAWFFSHRAKHKERMLLIEKGLATDEKVNGKYNFSFPWLKLGILILGLGVGLMIIGILAKAGWLADGVFPLAILIVCGGVSMVIANSVNNGNRKP